MDTIASREKICPKDTMEEKRYLSDKFMLRLPDGMRDRIKSKADENGRSMNAEILQLLMREYPEETYTAEDFLEMLNRVATVQSVEDQIANEEMLNQTLKHLNFDFSANIIDGAVFFARNSPQK